MALHNHTPLPHIPKQFMDGSVTSLYTIVFTERSSPMSKPREMVNLAGQRPCKSLLLPPSIALSPPHTNAPNVLLPLQQQHQQQMPHLRPELSRICPHPAPSNAFQALKTSCIVRCNNGRMHAPFLRRDRSLLRPVLIAFFYCLTVPLCILLAPVNLNKLPYSSIFLHFSLCFILPIETHIL